MRQLCTIDDARSKANNGHAGKCQQVALRRLQSGSLVSRRRKCRKYPHSHLLVSVAESNYHCLRRSVQTIVVVVPLSTNVVSFL